ncbi:ABC transporter [Sporanaerobium hydrogeniformans]|uniref:ABC transporter n=1 Tax=Sporanaerobium hydrogeniformans TaxID=3072179 RepID=A0AC61DAB7_9FIRM|nr:ABC transporter permease [Sporanaerobium hydrogeniformans]PHV69482.1 ABC transporter [Sporanaerobium hydrogeniformans]
MKKYLRLFKIEGKLALRGVDSIFFGVGMPVAIMLLIGIICGQKPAYEGATYSFLEGSFGALTTVGICATAFMGIPLTLADYRDKKILKHFFVTPVSPLMLLLVQVSINALLSVISTLLVAWVSVIGFGYEMQGSLGQFVGAYFLVLFSMYSLGMLIASVCRNIKVANVVCSIVYFPMLFLSGATIPYEIFPKGLQRIADFMPLTQGIKLLKGFSLGLPIDDLITPILVMMITIVIGVVGSITLFKWE